MTRWTIHIGKDRTIFIMEGPIQIARIIGSTAVGDQRIVFEKRAKLICDSVNLYRNADCAEVNHEKETNRKDGTQ